MPKFSSYPLLDAPGLDDYLVFSSGSNTYRIKTRNVLGAVSALTEATAAQQVDATTLFTQGGSTKVGPFSDILAFADGIRRMPLNQYRWGVYATYGNAAFNITGLIDMSGGSPSASPAASNQKVPYWEASPGTTSTLTHRSFDSSYFNFGIPAYCRARLRVAQLDNLRWNVGFVQSLTASDPTSVTNYAVLWYKSSESPNVKLLCADGTTVERVDTGIAMDTDYHIWEVVYTDGVVQAFRDGVLVASNATATPTSGNISCTVSLLPLENALKVMEVEYFMAVTKH